MSRNQLRKLHARRTRWMLRAQRRDRRGVLLMVVLSMLALFLLLGTAFLVSSRFYATTGKEAGKLNRTTNNPADLMERAMLQVLRDTNNPSSSIRYHSLLRDVYGSDGFIGMVYNTDIGSPPAVPHTLPEYAGSFASNTLGPTNGQFIDLFVCDGNYTGGLYDAPNVIKLDRAPDGTTIDHTLPAAKGYYNGCLLTFLGGPSAGLTTRIIDYAPVGFTTNREQVCRLRVMAFSRADGTNYTPTELTAQLQGNVFMVNGRANSGTGAGLNRLAQRGGAKLNAVEMSVGPGGLYGTEMALTPNLRFVDLTQAAAFIGGNDPFGITGATLANFTALNPNRATVLYPTAEGPGGSNESYDAVDYQNMFLAHMPVSPRATASLIDSNLNSVELGDADNVRIMLSNTIPMRPDMENTIVPSFHQPALVNYWNQRLHRAQWLMSAISDENVRAAAIISPYSVGQGGPGTPALDQIVAIKRKASLRPLREDHPNFDGSNPASAYSGTIQPVPGDVTLSLNNEIRFPAWEVVGPWDVDNDNDGINDSVWVDLGDPVQETENGTLYKPLYAFLIVDLDNRLNVNAHGSPDHFAAAPLDPMLPATGNRVGNLASGEQFALGNSAVQWSSNLMPHGMGWGPGDVNLRSILSPLTQPYAYAITRGTNVQDDYARLFFGRVAADLGSDAVWGRMGNSVTSGTFGPGRNFTGATQASINASREPSLAFEFVGYPVFDRTRAEQASNFDPQFLPYTAPTAFGTMPDLRGRYALGVDYMGQPVYESSYDGIIPGSPAVPSYIGQPLVTLVDESPYETYLSKDGRRGVPDQVAMHTALANQGSTGIVPNDDALFATSELERLLRRYDPETGTAPSRLFDIVDAFDPVKYVSTINVGSPEQNLAYAQTVTGINSRQVTTDSYEIPTPSDVVPSYITELGPDGAPGIVGVDDDGQDSDGNGEPIDDAVPFNPQTGLGEIGFFRIDSNNPLFMEAWSDDFASYTGKSVSEARFVDVVWYRIQRAREKRQLPIYNWNNPDAVAILNNICDQLLPPEVLAGYKMDVNRPFGDGRDNNGNGIVDEPLEGGEPWLDTDGNGIWEGEPFIDLDGDGRFYADANNDGVWNPNNNSDFVDLEGDGTAEPLVDNLWAAQLGGAPALLNSTMGKDVTGRTITPDGVLRDDAHLARQLYARHLYMLMLVLMDEDYLAPYDPYDPSVRGFIRIKGRLLESALGPFESKVEAQRRYTCRQIAQWAINCVDFRDSDSINTPFEYDEYPWDGWGTVNDGGDPTNHAGFTHYPLDGDPATDENFGQIMDWANMSANGQKAITNPIPKIGTGGNQLADLNATRGLVWGAERPELLISETAAFHDVRVEDWSVTDIKGDNTTSDDEAPDRPQDDDPDQRLKPRGSLFVEVYNPNSGDAPKPVELYRHGDFRNIHPSENADRVARFDRNGDNQVDGNDQWHWFDSDGDGEPDTRIEGVLLNRLSDRADRNGKRSPVWRLIVVEEHPAYHNELRTDPGDPTRDDATSHQGNLTGGGPNAFLPLADYSAALGAVRNESQVIPYLAPMNLDWDQMYYSPMLPRTDSTIPSTASEWFQKQTDEQTNARALDYMDEEQDYTRQLFAKPYPYIEREFYFTSNNTPYFHYVWAISGTTGSRNYNQGTVPERSYTDLSMFPNGGQLQERYGKMNVRIPFTFVETGRQRDLPSSVASLSHRFVAMRQDERDRDIQIAPIMPGRYGVIGSAGTMYTNMKPADSNGIHRYITAFGRIARTGAGADLTKTADTTHVGAIGSTRRFEMQPSSNPYIQQFLVGSNGARFGATEGDGARRNELVRVSGNTVNMTGKSNSGLKATSEVVAPSVAIPVENMSLSEPVWGYGVRSRELAQIQETSEATGHRWDPTKAGGEGGYTDDSGNNLHFDMPFDDDSVLIGPDGTPAYDRPFTKVKFRVVHLQRLADPTVPWNPPPSFNQAYRDRRVYTAHDPALPVNPYLTVDSASVDLTVFNGASSMNVQQPLAETTYRSTERLYEARRADATAMKVPARVTLGQDYFMTLSKLPTDVFNMALARHSSIPSSIVTDHVVEPNHHNFYYKHSLGLPNESLGPVYLRPETGLPANMIDPTDIAADDGDSRTMGAALGAPRPDTDTGVESTAPWMTWNNRPFVSESELLQVPGWSSMELLRKFSGMNTALAAQTAAMNPYNGGFESNPLNAESTNSERYKRMTAGFGHLLNFNQSSTSPAVIKADPSNNPVCVGAPNFHRILDYVHTPSRFVATDTLLNPVAFSAATVTSPDDPRSGKAAPFNRVPDYREPGKVNLNTVVSQRVPGVSVWSDVFDGLMHRVRDADPYQINNTLGYGHLGPAWKDVVWSRRGYADPVLPNHLSGVDRVDLVLDNNHPTFFRNPFRSSEAGDLVPLESLKDGGVDVTMLRAHPVRPGANFQWGNPGNDDNNNQLVSDTREAGWPTSDDVPLVTGTPTPEVAVPLFSELTSTPGIDAPRNSAMHYMPLTRIDNLTTTRSGVFAVWVTVGYFEVLPAPNWDANENNVRQKFQNQTGDTADPPLRARALYDKVYPQGYQLGKELKSETGDVDRHRSFYIIDRTRPVAFKPGEDVNVEDAILLRRRID